MKEYRNLTRPELEAELAAVRAEYDALKAKGLQLNMARGKPGKQQLDMVSGLFDVFHTPEDFLSTAWTAGTTASWPASPPPGGSSRRSWDVGRARSSPAATPASS